MRVQGNFYTPFVLALVPRLLTNLDRDTTSPTYGSFDRNHWHYKIRSFSSAVLQQAVLPLAICYSHEFPGNVYYADRRVREWIRASLRYWAASQNRDGSYDEYWKAESSFPATAFSAFAAAEASLIMGEADERLARALSRSMRFLGKRRETFASNQEIVSACALFNAHLLTGDKEYLQKSDEKIERLKAAQTEDGFFPEHGGPDIGYSSVALEYLSVLFEKTGREDVRAMCDRLIEFLSYFVLPHAPAGGHYASRNTEYVLPGGLESAASFNARAASMLQALKAEAEAGQCIPPGVDERYLLHYLGYSMARALILCADRPAGPVLPCQTRMRKLFSRARLYVYSDPPLYLVISLFKGGAFRLYSDGALIYEDTGYRLLGKRRVLHTEIGPCLDFSAAEGEVRVTKRFFAKGYTVITPLRSFILFLYSSVFGNALWDHFRRRFIQAGRATGIVWKRSIRIKDLRVTVTDEIAGLPRALLIKNPPESMKSIPSAKFFSPRHLGNLAEPASYEVAGEFRLQTAIDAGQKKVL